jgi:hypothetical protein
MNNDRSGKRKAADNRALRRAARMKTLKGGNIDALRRAVVRKRGATG